MIRNNRLQMVTSLEGFLTKYLIQHTSVEDFLLLAKLKWKYCNNFKEEEMQTYLANTFATSYKQ